MDISEKLDIFLITYNRAKKLDKTLSQILAIDSPIKDFIITVIDNNSTDDTSLIVQKYQKTNSNLLYEKNRYNIGGNGNIARTFEKAGKEYIWILCDNDNFCWDNWGEVVESINKGAEGIVVSLHENPRIDIAQLFIQTTFLPGVIYKTSNINNDVILNMQFNIQNMFPHLVLSAKLLNENKKFDIVTKSIVLYGDNRDEETGKEVYNRGYNEDDLHPLLQNMNWLSGYANSIHMIKDKKIRNYIINHNRFYMAPLNSANIFFINDKISNGSLYNLFCMFSVLNFWGKIKFILNYILFLTVFRIVYVYSDITWPENLEYVYKQYRLRLFYFLKIKLFKVKIKHTGG